VPCFKTYPASETEVLEIDLLGPRVVLSEEDDFYWETLVEVHLYTDPGKGRVDWGSFRALAEKFPYAIFDRFKRFVPLEVQGK
jgi:hypothetical protein